MHKLAIIERIKQIIKLVIFLACLNTPTPYINPINNESTIINGKASEVVLQVGTLKKVSLRVKNKKKSTVSLSWKKADGAKKYQIYRATRKKGKYSKITTTKKLTYEDTSLSKNKTYYYKVRAYYVKAGKNIYGSYSNVKSVKITK